METLSTPKFKTEMIKLTPEDYATLASSTKELAEALIKTEEYRKLITPYCYPTGCVAEVSITVAINHEEGKSAVSSLTIPVEDP